MLYWKPTEDYLCWARTAARQWLPNLLDWVFNCSLAGSSLYRSCGPATVMYRVFF